LNHGDTTGVALIFYGLDRNAAWHILSGADPNTLVPSNPDPTPIRGNSIDHNMGTATLTRKITIPAVDPARPETDIQLVFIAISYISDQTPNVPPDPLGSNFGLP
jgi:hypothetical protein